MGYLNEAPTCVAMMMNLQMEWDKLAKECDLKNYPKINIIDDVLLYVRTSDQLIAYFITVLDVLKHHRATIKLKK